MGLVELYEIFIIGNYCCHIANSIWRIHSYINEVAICNKSLTALTNRASFHPVSSFVLKPWCKQAVKFRIPAADKENKSIITVNTM